MKTKPLIFSSTSSLFRVDINTINFARKINEFAHKIRQNYHKFEKAAQQTQ